MPPKAAPRCIESGVLRSVVVSRIHPQVCTCSVEAYVNLSPQRFCQSVSVCAMDDPPRIHPTTLRKVGQIDALSPLESCGTG